MTNPKKAAVFVDKNYEDLELWYPAIRLKEAGFHVLIVGTKQNETFAGKWGYPCKTDLDYDQLLALIEKNEIEALIIPGGFAPDRIRQNKSALECVKKLNFQKKPIGFICHGGWVAISAGILQGKKATSTPAIKDDMENAGCIWEDSSLVIDGHLFSSRNPQDLPNFCQGFFKIYSA